MFAMWKHGTGCISFGTQSSVWKRVKMKVECHRWENLTQVVFPPAPYTFCVKEGSKQSRKMFCNGKNWHSLLLHLYPTASVCILFGTQPPVRKRVKMKVLFAMWKHDTGCISFGTQPSVWKRVKMKVECLRWENLSEVKFPLSPYRLCTKRVKMKLECLRCENMTQVVFPLVPNRLCKRGLKWK